MPVILTQSPAPQNKTKQNKKTGKTPKDPQNCKSQNQTKNKLFRDKIHNKSRHHNIGPFTISQPQR